MLDKLCHRQHRNSDTAHADGMQRPGNTQNQPQASKPRPGDPDRRGMRGRAGDTLFVCNLAILHTSAPLPPRTHGHTDTRHHQQGFSLPTSILYIAIALSHENEYHFLKILLKVPHYVKPGNCLPYYLFKQFFLFADSCECSLLKL